MLITKTTSPIDLATHKKDFTEESISHNSTPFSLGFGMGLSSMDMFEFFFKPKPNIWNALSEKNKIKFLIKFRFFPWQILINTWDYLVFTIFLWAEAQSQF